MRRDDCSLFLRGDRLRGACINSRSNEAVELSEDLRLDAEMGDVAKAGSVNTSSRSIGNGRGGIRGRSASECACLVLGLDFCLDIQEEYSSRS